MKAITNYTKEIGIILSYTLTFVMCIYFEWRTIVFFATYLIEIGVVFLIFLIQHFIEKKRNTNNYINSGEFGYVFNSVVVILFFQTYIIYKNSYEINQVSFTSNEKPIVYELVYISIVLSVIYIVDTLRIKETKKRLIMLKESLLSKMLILYLTCSVGLYFITQFKLDSVVVLFLIMTLTRIAVEIIFMRNEFS